MDGVSETPVTRPVRLARFADIIQPGRAAPTIQQQPRYPPRNDNRCLNAFYLLTIYFVGIGSLFLGTMRLNDCPAQKMLPKSLVIFGGMLMVSRLLNCFYDCQSIRDKQPSPMETTPTYLLLLNALFCLAEFGIFIALCYYAFSVDPTTKIEDYGDKNYCDYGLYKSSFYGCIIALILFGLAFLTCCCVIYLSIKSIEAHYTRPMRRNRRRFLSINRQSPESNVSSTSGDFTEFSLP